MGAENSDLEVRAVLLRYFYANEAAYEATIAAAAAAIRSRRAFVRRIDATTTVVYERKRAKKVTPHD